MGMCLCLVLHSSVRLALGRGQRPLCLGESVEGTAAHSCTRGLPRTDSTILRIDETLSSSTRVREHGSLWSRQLRWLDSRQASLAKAKARPVNTTYGAKHRPKALVTLRHILTECQSIGLLWGERGRGGLTRGYNEQPCY